jgi:hypothetical protein
MADDLLRQTALARIVPPLTGDLGERERKWIHRAFAESILPWHMRPVAGLPPAQRLPVVASMINDLLLALLPLPAVTRFQEIIRMHYEARVEKVAAEAFALARTRADSETVDPALVRQVATVQGRIGSVARELQKLQLVSAAEFLPRLADAMLDCRYAMFGKPVTTLHLHRYLQALKTRMPDGG